MLPKVSLKGEKKERERVGERYKRRKSERGREREKRQGEVVERAGGRGEKT